MIEISPTPEVTSAIFKLECRHQLERAYRGLIRDLKEAGKLKLLAIPKERHRFSLVLEI